MEVEYKPSPKHLAVTTARARLPAIALEAAFQLTTPHGNSHGKTQLVTQKTPQDRLAVNARPTPQWDSAPEGVLASRPQVGLGGAGLGLRSSKLYLNS